MCQVAVLGKRRVTMNRSLSAGNGHVLGKDTTGRCRIPEGHLILGNVLHKMGTKRQDQDVRAETPRQEGAGTTGPNCHGKYQLDKKGTRQQDPIVVFEKPQPEGPKLTEPNCRVEKATTRGTKIDRTQLSC